MKGGKSKANSRKADSKEGFRKDYKEKHPNNKSVAVVGKAGGEKWKSMSDEEKTLFIQKAVKRKEEYEQKMADYNKKLASGANDDEPDKSKSEVNDDEDGEGSGEVGCD